VKINEYIKSIFKAPKTPTKAVEQRALQFFKQTITANNIGDLSVTQMLSNYSFICMNKIAELVANQKYTLVVMMQNMILTKLFQKRIIGWLILWIIIAKQCKYLLMNY